MEYTSQDRIKTLWVPMGQHFSNFWVRWTLRWVAGRQQYQTPCPNTPPPPPTTCQYDSRKEPQKSGWRNEISLTKEKLFLVWHYGTQTFLISWRLLLSSIAFRYATADDASMLSISEKNASRKFLQPDNFLLDNLHLALWRKKVLEAEKKMASSGAVRDSFLKGLGEGLCILHLSIGSHTHTHTRVCNI